MNSETVGERRARKATWGGWLRFFLKLAVGIGLIILVFNRLPVTDVLATLFGANPAFYGLGYATLLILSILQGVQLAKAIPARPPRMTVLMLVRLQFISVFYSVLVPSGVTLALVKWRRLSKAGAVSTDSAAVVIYLRIVNIVAGVMLALGGVLLDDQASDSCPRWTIAMLLLVVLACSLAMLSRRLSRLMARLLVKLCRPLPLPQALQARIAEVWAAMTVLNERPHVLRVLTLGLGAVITFLFSVACWFFSVSVGMAIGIPGFLWIQFVLLFITFLPVSFMGFGLREATFASMLPVVYAVKPASALSLSLLIFGWQLLSLAIGGLCELYETLKRKGTQEA